MCCPCCLLSTVSPLAQNSSDQIIILFSCPALRPVRQASRRDHLHPTAPRAFSGQYKSKSRTNRDAYELPLAQFHKDPIHVVRLLRLSIRPRAVVSDPAHSTARTIFATLLRASPSPSSPRTCAYASESRNLPDRLDTPPKRITKAIAVSANISEAFFVRSSLPYR